ncbi:MAG: hypothetical protein WCV82_03850 [Candidatus Paceibacterota bacterium]
MAKPKTSKNTETEEPKIDQIEAILAEKEFKGLHLGSRSGSEIARPDIVSTGSFFFDQVLGGGFRSSCWSRFYGSEESGKSSQGLCWGRQWQRHYGERGMVIVFNAEGRVTADLIARSGIDTSKDRFRIIDSNKSDFIYTMIDRLVSNNEDDRLFYFIVDSTDACERTVDIGKNLGEAEKIGGTATILSAAGKRLSLVFSVTGHHLYMTSQTRDKVNTHGPGAGGKQASGGNAPKFYSSLTGQIVKHWSDLAIRETSDAKSKEIGRMVNIKMEKTPNETTGTVVAFPVKYGHIGGIWREYEAFLMCKMGGNMTDKGSGNISFNEKYVEELKAVNIELDRVSFKGEPMVRAFFEANPDLVNHVHAEARRLFIA